ncbi:asparagine synthase (glutamine-hydrolyzing) [Nitrogeniibacter aestuarii]|uniref:asparagine synthase (glutamine-hydrolyzing) n=1 Tax=Nitrogeniibacter aestuarii TaxID=2815343 RepID=UPI001D1198C0|nr:asparagine synthase (glutamine-hydrolyzing) [Nitrogeniibacter aestuarii]
MCGIAGFWHRTVSGLDLQAIAGRMADALTHRGPDERGVWVETHRGFGMGHRRLSVVDLSPAGAQPMCSSDGRLVVAFNGEIYNHLALREDLPAQEWRGHSDTESLLAAFSHWGVEATLPRLAGMFAIAVWDRDLGSLLLARDRLGEKPLYYGFTDGALFFGSELKALAQFPGWRGEIDRFALERFVRFGYVPTPLTIWQNVFKLPPGHFLRIGDVAELSPARKPRPYWRAVDHWGNEKMLLDDGAAVGELESRLKESISGQMIADVPLGAFLSGGVDSSTVVALMQEVSQQPVKTYTIGFDNEAYDEARYARPVAKHLGTDHTELILSAGQAMEVIPRLSEIYDEPFGDSSQLATALVCLMARQHVTVCLSGDGGDELFGGYNRYLFAPGIWRRMAPLPTSVRALLRRVLSSISPASWDALGRALPQRFMQPMMGDRIHKLAGLLDAGSPQELYQRLTAQNLAADKVVRAAPASRPLFALAQRKDFDDRCPEASFAQQMMIEDLLSYLPDDILTKVDRAAMSVSLETRIPMLDHRVVEFAGALPHRFKIRDGQGKWLLRQVLYKRVPRHLIERPKQGFGVPIDAWLRGPLREWAEHLLDERRMREDGWLEPELIRKAWANHLSGRQNCQHWLWNILMFQAWRERWT